MHTNETRQIQRINNLLQLYHHIGHQYTPHALHHPQHYVTHRSYLFKKIMQAHALLKQMQHANRHPHNTTHCNPVPYAIYKHGIRPGNKQRSHYQL